MLNRLRGLLSLVSLLLLLVGVPAVLVRSHALVAPSRWPSATDVADTVAQGRVSPDSAIAVLALVVVVLWMRFIVSVLLAMWCAVRRRSVPRVLVLGGSTQRWAVNMVAGLTLLFGVHTPVSAAAPTARVAIERVVHPSGAASRPATAVDPLASSDASCPAPATSSGRSLPVGPGAALLLAGGLVATVEARRRGLLRSARPGSRMPLPSSASASLERRVRELSPLDRLVRVDVAVRALAAGLLDSGASPSVQPVAVIVHADGRVDTTLSEGAMLPAPFEMLSSDWWRLPAEVAIADIAPMACRVNAPMPLLVHLGEAEGGELFVDLEALGALVIDALPESADTLMRMIIASLCTSPFASSALLIAAGVDGDALVERPTAEHVDTVDAALDLAAMTLGSTAAVTSNGMTTFRLRSQNPNEGWEPSLVLIGSGCDMSAAETADAVALTAKPGRGLAILAGRPLPGATWTLREEAENWVLQPLGMVIRPVGITVDEVQAVRQLLDESSRPLPTDPDPLAARRLLVQEPAVSSPPWQERPWSIVVRVLGPVGIETADGQITRFEKAKSLELIVWLSCHRERPSRSGARTALWDTDVRDATFANVVSEARRALSRATPPPTGSEWLGRSTGETLPLHAEVVTDADLLEARVEHARLQSPRDAITTLRDGLAWVRGLAFADSGYLWPDGDGITSRLVLLVTTAAAEMAQLCLDAGDIEGVFWATGRGLSVLPGHEELVGLRMRAHADRGDLSAVRQEWDSYVRALHADTWGDQEPSPKLVELRRTLLEDPAHAFGAAALAVRHVL